MLSELILLPDEPIPHPEEDIPEHVLDAAIEAWVAAWDRIGGLTPDQRERYRVAMRATLAAARAAERRWQG
jgi:hypothetical protein